MGGDGMGGMNGMNGMNGMDGMVNQIEFLPKNRVSSIEISRKKRILMFRNFRLKPELGKNRRKEDISRKNRYVRVDLPLSPN